MSFSVDENSLMKCLRQANPDSSRIRIKKYDCKPFSITPGSNFTSEIFGVWVAYDCDGASREVRFVFKVPQVHKFYQRMEKVGVYAKESYMYETLVPKLLKIAPLPMLPKHYHTGQSHLLALEDLVAQGYSLGDSEPWNFERSVRLLKELARLHAASVRLGQLEPSVLEAASVPTLFRRETIVNSLNHSYLYLVEILKDEPAKVFQNFIDYKAKIDNGDIYEICGRVHDFRVLVHGNLKANNILLKKDESGALSSVKIIDYQTYLWNSPVFDLLYFFILSGDCDVFEKCHDKLVDVYLGALNESLSNLNCDCTYSKGDYLADIRGSRLYQVYTWMFASNLVVREIIPGCFPKDGGHEPSQDDIVKIRESKLFQGKSLKWFRYFEKRGYFD